MKAERRYGSYDSKALIPRALEDMTLLYHRASGQTHMVISPVPEILGALGDGSPMSAGEVHDCLARDYDLGPKGEAVAQIEAHLEGLAALGLVRSR